MRLPPGSRPWILGVIAMFLIQAAALHWGVVQVQSIRQPAPTKERFFMSLGRDLPEGLDTFARVASPTLFALPSLEGFSGSAWLRYGTPRESESLPADNPVYLEIDTNRLGEPLRNFASSMRPPTLDVGDWSVAWREIFPLDVPPSPVSRLSVQGNLAHRRILNAGDLPTWPFPDVITDSTVSVWVDEDGRVLSAVLIEPEGRVFTALQAASSRSPDADRFALAYVQQMRFAPHRSKLPQPVLPDTEAAESGTIVFRWASVPVVSTNKAVFPGS